MRVTISSKLNPEARAMDPRYCYLLFERPAAGEADVSRFDDLRASHPFLWDRADEHTLIHDRKDGTISLMFKFKPQAFSRLEAKIRPWSLPQTMTLYIYRHSIPTTNR